MGAAVSLTTRLRPILLSSSMPATELTRKALEAGAICVVAVGGDGSLSEVVEGFFAAGSHEKVSETAMLAYLPSGTGGDFRKSLQWTSKYEDAVAAVLRGQTRKVDIGHVLLGVGTACQRGRHFLNIASCGSSALIAQVLVCVHG